MATNSAIIVQRTDGQFEVARCNWDGYLGHCGRILQHHYASQDRAEALVAPGDMSSIDESIEAPPGHSYENRIPGYTVFYGRDRGEDNTASRTYSSLKDALGEVEQYTYVWTEGRWHWLDGGQLKSLEGLV